AIVEEMLFDSLGGRDTFAESDVQLIRSDRENPDHNDLAFAMLRISVMDPDAKKAGKLFSAKVVELALSSIPGFTLTGPPSGGTPAIRHWPTLVDSGRITQVVHMDGETIEVPQCPEIALAAARQPVEPQVGVNDQPCFEADDADTREMPLGRLFATRSGDKGGNANLGVWAKNETAYAYLRSWLTADRLKLLLPDLGKFEIERYELPNLLAVNFYIRGLLGHGVAASMRSDPQAKTLGEYLRAKVIAVPVSIV
ncbi:MAG: exopolyphosphatase, partial [Desulfobacterales bacterium]|nr:exopolyphosphatase [Desulfobacterales bacterium]